MPRAVITTGYQRYVDPRAHCSVPKSLFPDLPRLMDEKIMYNANNILGYYLGYSKSLKTSGLKINAFWKYCTVPVLRTAHRKWKETKQEPGTTGPGNMLGCCLVSFHFLWAILSMSTVNHGRKGQMPLKAISISYLIILDSRSSSSNPGSAALKRTTCTECHSTLNLASTL